MSNQLKVAVVGCGYWGKNLVRVFHELGALHCVCDQDPKRLDPYRQVAPATTTRLRDLLDDSSLRALAIATPAATHSAVVREALEAGKDVLVEKPLALTAAEGQQLVEMAAARQRILMVGHILLYHPAIEKLRELVQQGALGRVRYCYSNRLNLGLIRTEENILWSFAPHDISVLLWLLGEEPVAIEAEGQSYLTPGVVDVTLSRLRFPSGTTAHIFVSWLHPSKEQRLVIVGSEQMAVFDDTSAQKLVLYPHRVDWTEGLPRAVKAEAVPVQLDNGEPLRRECQHFLDCVARRHTPRTDGQEGLRVLRVLDACQRSLERVPPPVATSPSAPQVPLPAAGAVAPPNSSPLADYFAHPTACLDQPCSIGPGTKIWHFSHVMKGAKLGPNCSLGQNVVVASTAVLGQGVKVQNNVSIYDGVILEDHVFCGPSMVFTNVVNPRSEIVRKSEYRPTLVRHGATLGANCTVVCGHTIGRYAFVAAGAVVTDDVPDFALMAGVPARQVGWICHCAGGRLHFDNLGMATCPACRATYRLCGGQVVPQEPDPASS